MNYDVWGSWSAGVGPNAPLYDSCAPTQAGSASSAVKAWSSAGFPASKASPHFLPKTILTWFTLQIVLGVPAYGHGYYVSPSAALNSSGNLAAYPPFDTTKLPLSDDSASTSSKYWHVCTSLSSVLNIFQPQIRVETRPAGMGFSHSRIWFPQDFWMRLAPQHKEPIIGLIIAVRLCVCSRSTWLILSNPLLWLAIYLQVRRWDHDIIRWQPKFWWGPLFQRSDYFIPIRF